MERSTRHPKLRLCRDENGATAVEYALMAGLIAGVIAVAVAAIGPTLVTFFAEVNAAL
ncbi:MAG: Flp family type IVb pilin [Dermatophilaceae bacterium]